MGNIVGECISSHYSDEMRWKGGIGSMNRKRKRKWASFNAMQELRKERNKELITCGGNKKL